MKLFSVILLGLISYGALAQKDSALLLTINSQLDEGVVKKDIPFLQKHYADDFVFTHGGGLVEDKSSWIKNVSSPNSKFISRTHDSTSVELHGNVALVTGKMEIVRKDKDKEVAYGLRYIRVYRKNKNVWQMISHRTTHYWSH
jgi:ketosteroid isomerase-like protein